jgi:hypothetical protein
MDTDLLFQERETLLRNQKPDFANFAQIDERSPPPAGSKAAAAKTKSLQPEFGKSDRAVAGAGSEEKRCRNSYESIWLKQTGASSTSKVV